VITATTLLPTAPLPAATVSLSLADIPRRALTHNPDLAAARLQILEARGRLGQAGRLSNPELEVEYAKSTRGKELNAGVSFNQSFPLTARLRQEKTLSRYHLAKAEAEVRDAERKLIEEVMTAAVNLLAVAQERELIETQAKRAAALTEAVEKRTRAGEISPTDAAQLAIEGQHGLLELQQLRGRHAKLAGELKPLLGLPENESLVIRGSLPGINAPPRRGAATDRPDLEAARQAELAARSETDLARSSRWEDVTAGILYEREHVVDDPSGLERENFVGFRLSLPLPLWNRQKGLIAEKEAGEQRAALERKALESRILAEAAAARAEMQSHAQLHADTNSNLLPAIARHTETIESAYNKGEADLLTLLRSREQLLHAETAALEALRDYHLARVRHEAATSTQPGLPTARAK
jgi:outer membrane protein TolC